MNRDQCREFFKKHRGLQAEIARSLKVSKVTITLWLDGKVESKRLDHEIPAFIAGMQTAAQRL